MRASVFVGRVGGLAVALGIGSGVAVGGVGAAWAAPADSASAETADSASEATSARSTSGQTAARQRAGRSTRVAEKPAVADPVRAGAFDRVEVPVGTSPGRAARTSAALPPEVSTSKNENEAAAETVVPASSAASQDSSDQPVALPTAAESPAPLAVPPATTASTAEPVLIAPVTEPPSTTVVPPVMVPTPAPSAAAPGVVQSVLAPISGNGPVAPGESAVSWVMLAAARRELAGRADVQVAPAATLTTGQLVEPSGASAEGTPRAAVVAESQQTTPSFGDILNYTFFHKSVTANPEQVVGQSVTGVVTGNLNAVSANGATMIYALAERPTNGNVVLFQDGSYTYTPNSQTALSGGSDNFSVTIDNGSAYRLTGIGGAIQGIFSALAQLVGLRQPDTVTVQVPVTVAPTIVTIPVGTGPGGVAVSPDGRWVYTANYGDDTVTVVDAANSMIARTIAVGPESCGGLCEGPYALAVSPDGTRLYASGGSTPVFNPDGSVDYFEGKAPLTVIDTASGTIVERYDHGWGTSGGNLATSPDGHKLYMGLNSWVLGQPDGVMVLDLAMGTTTYLGVTSIVVAPSADGKTIALVDWRGDGTVYAFDVATNTELWSTGIVSSNKNFYGRGAVFGDGKVYVGVVGPYSTGAGVAVLDAATGNLITVVQTSVGPGADPSYQGVAVSPDGKRVYAVDSGKGTLSVIDTDTNTLIATTDLGGAPSGVTVSPDGDYVYVANRTDGTLSIIPVGVG